MLFLDAESIPVGAILYKTLTQNILYARIELVAQNNGFFGNPKQSFMLKIWHFEGTVRNRDPGHLS